MSDEAECLDWLVSLSVTLAKAPYKDTDNALTLVNTNRTDVSLTIATWDCQRRNCIFELGGDGCGSDADCCVGVCAASLWLRRVVQRMRGGDEFRMRASPDSDDSDDESSAAVNKRRRQAKSTLAESWRLYLMQIPRQWARCD